MINEDNSALVGKGYGIPLNIKQFLQTKVGENNEGTRRILGLLNAPTATYEQLKRIKHDLSGGLYQGDWSPVLNWINGVLGRDTGMIDNQKRTPMEIGMENRFKKTHDKDHNKNLTPLSSFKHTSIRVTEEQLKLIGGELIKEQNKTICQTPDTQFHTHIEEKTITCKIDLPMSLNLDKEESKILETNIHNAMELVLAKYFNKE